MGGVFRQSAPSRRSPLGKRRTVLHDLIPLCNVKDGAADGPWGVNELPVGAVFGTATRQVWQHVASRSRACNLAWALDRSTLASCPQWRIRWLITI
jgi:hypothetical protein